MSKAVASSAIFSLGFALLGCRSVRDEAGEPDCARTDANPRVPRHTNRTRRIKDSADKRFHVGMGTSDLQHLQRQIQL